MPSITALFGQIAGILSLAAFFPYIISILKGRTRPNRATWIIWTAVGFMLGASYYSSGARETMWVPVSYIVGPFTTVIFSLKYGEGGWTKFDRMCLAGAGISVVLWWLSGSALIALLINLFIDFLGALPTIRKVCFDPRGESKPAWFLFFAGNTANMFAMEKWTFAIAVYPVWMFLGSGAIAALVFFPKWRIQGLDVIRF